MGATYAATEFALPNTNSTHYTHPDSYMTSGENATTPSGLNSPGSMTTGSTNPSPLVPLLDYDLGFDNPAVNGDPQLLSPEPMSCIVGLGDWQAQDFDFAAFPWPISYSENAASLTSPSKAPPQEASAWDCPAVNSHTCLGTPDNGADTSLEAPAPPCVSSPPTPTAHNTPHWTCPICKATFADKTKLKVHTNKHTKPFRCSAAGCDYSTAEKKSLQRHLLARSKRDEEHRLATQESGLKGVSYRCCRSGCTYSTFRDDNFKRHLMTCL